MDTPIYVAMIAGVVTLVGWIVNHQLTHQREERIRRHAASLKFVERQLEELYGPLAFFLHEGRRSYLDLLDTLGRDLVFTPGENLSDDELRMWLFWAENSFLPKNQHMKELLMGKTHLIEGASFPESYVAFLDHHNSWMINHERWQKQEVEYSWHSKVDWPVGFETDVLATFEMLKAKHAKLIGELADGSQLSMKALTSRGTSLCSRSPIEAPRKTTAEANR